MQSWPRRIISSRWFMFCCFLVIVFLAFSFFKEFSRRYHLQQQVEVLKKQATEIEGQNQEFSQLIEYFQTQKFTEEEARLKMGLKKPGEEVLVINQASNSVRGVKAEGVDETDLSNPVKWWYYFFKQK